MAATSTYIDNNLSHDRLGFAFCMALALHAALILGIGFSQHERTVAAPKLEITLAQYRSEQAPEEADFLAQSNQQGSGTLLEKAMLTSNEQADFQDIVARDINRQQRSNSSEAKLENTNLLSSTQSLQKTSKRQRQDHAVQREGQSHSDISILQRSIEIASLEARFDTQQYAYARRPRIRRLTSMATRQSDDALYLHNWRTKVEMVGNQHYPSKAKQQQLHGDLRMVVSLLPNGAVHKVRILESSGHKILDQAAIKIVHLAAPYAPFPQQMQKNVDVLEIIRTWRFHRNRLSSST